MRKQIIFWLLCVVLVSLSSCKKSIKEFARPEDDTVAEFKEFYENDVKTAPVQTYAQAAVRKARSRDYQPQWSRAMFRDFRGTLAVIVLIKYHHNSFFYFRGNVKSLFSLDDLSKLVFYKDSDNRVHAELVLSIPDANARPGKFSGIISVEDLRDKSLSKRLKIDNNGKVKIEAQNKESTSNTSLLSTRNESAVLVCYEISGFNYSEDDPDGYYWSESLGCEIHYIEGASVAKGLSGTDYGTVAGGGSTYSSAPYPILINGDNVIGNIQDYNKCFSNTPGDDHTYKVSVCVAQPVPGTRETWGFSNEGSSSSTNPIMVGHAFLVLEQSSPAGTIVRNVGFYPQNGATPITPDDNGQLNNDAARGYNISVTITMTSSEFTSVLNYVNQSGNMRYNLNSNNCTSFVLAALGSAGIDLPRTKGSWTNGYGYNPGDLGEDIRNMKLPPNMSRNTTFNNHPNQGNCQ